MTINKRNILCLFLLLSFPLVICANAATVTMNLGFGYLTTSASNNIPIGSLWAIITENSANVLPGGLSTNGSFAVGADDGLIVADFAGASIAIQNVVGGGIVVATGQYTGDNVGFVIQGVNVDYDAFAALGLSPNDRFGFYWFPDLDSVNNVLPVGSSFEIGGFHQSTSSAPSGGDAGMSMPVSGLVNISYADAVTTSGATPFDPVLFRSVLIPEPASSLLFLASCLLFFRRQR